MVTLPGEGSSRRVAVASNLRLIAETVTAALGGRGFTTVRIAWPQFRADEPPEWQLERARPDVVLLIAELGLADDVTRAQRLIRSYEGTWLVMSGSGPGPFWGAMLEAGAGAVVPTT